MRFQLPLRFVTRAPLARALAAAALASLACGACSKGPGREDKWIQDAAIQARPAAPLTPTPAANGLAATVMEARARLADFYFKMFPSVIQSGFYKTQPPMLQADHYAHRLLIPDADPTRAEAERLLGEEVKVAEILIRKGALKIPVRTAWFPDEFQTHRDQYALIMSEMGVQKIGGASFDDLVQGARLDFGYWKQSKRADLPWTFALMAKNGPRTGLFRNAEGASFTLTKLARAMSESSVPPDSRGEYSCYDYHILYSMVVGTAEGFDVFLPAARDLFAKAFERNAILNAPDRPRRDSNEALVGRVKVNGHLIEAFFRGGERDFPLEDYRPRIEMLAQELLRDATELAKSAKYEGTPDVFIAVPHAIHGLDLAARRLGGGLGETKPVPEPPPAAPAKTPASSK